MTDSTSRPQLHNGFNVMKIVIEFVLSSMAKTNTEACK